MSTPCNVISDSQQLDNAWNYHERVTPAGGKDMKIRRRLLGNREGNGIGYKGTIVRLNMIKLHYTMYENVLCKTNILELK